MYLRISILSFFVTGPLLAQEPFNPPAPPPRQPASSFPQSVSFTGPSPGILVTGRATIVTAGNFQITGSPFSFTDPASLIQIEPGLLQGDRAGSTFLAGSELVNSSVMRSRNVGALFYSTAFITNSSSGLIEAPTAIRVLNGPAYILNRGRLDGSVLLEDQRNSVQLFTASTITGRLNLGANRNSQLVLSGGGSTKFSEVVQGRTQLAGSLFKTDGGTWDIDRPLTAGRATSVLSGQLLVSSRLTSRNVTVANGATLGGNGRIIGNLINSGTLGTRAGRPGTLGIDGDFTQSASGTFRTRLASISRRDQLVVSGQTSLDGTLKVSLFNGFKPQPGDRFVIITSEDGVTGQFASLEQPDSTDFRIRYRDDRVVLFLAGISGLIQAPVPPPIPTIPDFVESAETPNQFAVARALDRLAINATGDETDVITELRTLPDPELRAAFDEISPTLYTALPTIALTLANAQAAQFNQRFDVIRRGERGFHSPGDPLPEASVADPGKTVVEENAKEVINFDPNPDNPWGAFLTGSGTFAKVNSIADLPDYRFDTGTITLGIDRRFGAVTVGIFSGYSGTRARFDDGSRLDLNSARFGLYGTAQSGGFYINALASGAYHSYRVRRDIDFGDVDRTARSRPEGGEFHALLSGGYDHQIANWTFGAITSLQYTYLGVGAFSEDGADSLDTRIESEDTDSLRSGLGARIAYTCQITPTVALIPEIRAEWQHEFLGYAPVLSASLDGGNGANFDVNGDDQARNTILAGAGVTALLGDHVSASAFYNPDFGGGSVTAHTIAASLEVGF